MRLDPNNAAAAHANLGWALLESGKPRESIPEFEAALHLKPELQSCGRRSAPRAGAVKPAKVATGPKENLGSAPGSAARFCFVVASLCRGVDARQRSAVATTGSAWRFVRTENTQPAFVPQPRDYGVTGNFERFVRQTYLIVSQAAWLNGPPKSEKTGATPHPGKKIPFSARANASRDACATATFERPDLLILLGLAIVTFGIYAQVIGHHFITFDDAPYITENSMVNRGVTPAGLAWAFTTFHAAYWHPLTWIAHMIDSQLFGMFAGGHLLVNALIHATNTLLVFWFLLRTTRARWPSALVAALFALHPLHVESVAWAAERKDTLSTFFGLAFADRLCALRGGAFD